MRNLPLTLGNGSLNFYQSGSSVVLDTAFDLALWYDWKQHLQVEVGPELYGALCGLCGNANRSSSDSVIDSNGTIKTADLTLPWVVKSGAGSCIEDCVGASCPVCTRSQTKFPDINGNSLRVGCSLLKRSGGPFADCHSLVDPEPFLRSCTHNLCLNESASSMCEILTDYANICQRISARVRNWRTIAKCREFKIYIFLSLYMG